jgi:hypothetical protein
MSDPVQAQLDAYNARGVEAFARCYAEDVRACDADGKVLFSGQAGLRQRYAALFASSPLLRAEVTQRTRIGTEAAWYVIDTEVVSGRNEPGSPARFSVLVMYSGRAALIHEVRFLTPRVPLAD